MPNINPFTINIPDATLADLKQRLAQTRWIDALQGAGWDYGTDLTYLKSLIDYWQNNFDWRAAEQKLNGFNHFTTEIDGFKLHFIHERGKGPNPMPLIISHGWPSCFFEMTKIIPMLTDPARFGADPAQSFDVIVPSLPGFGFSDKPREPGWNVPKIATLMHQLMTDVLGYSKYAAQGADWGVSISARLGFHYPESVMGIHTTTANGGTPYELLSGTRAASSDELKFLAGQAAWIKREGAYAHMQRTKPQTFGYALNDSPVGLAAELVEKYRSWSDCQGDVETRFSKDDLLTFITLYWATQTIHSSMRIYYEHYKNPWILAPNEKITVPCAISGFLHDNVPPLREWAERFYNIQQFHEFDQGGHFPAFEEPELLAADIREFFYGMKVRD